MAENPLLVGFITKDRKQVKVWCPYCKSWHYHGIDGGMFKRKGSHRVEHCYSESSPFEWGGYYIRIIYKKDKEDILL